MKRILSLLIAAVMLLLLPADILAVSVSGTQNEPTRVRQLEELRESNSDTYLLSDGSYECVIYAGDKYYKDDSGKYVEIDNSIVKAPVTRAGKDYQYKNAAAAMNVGFASNEPSVFIESEANSISFSLAASNRTQARVGSSVTARSIAGFTLHGENFLEYRNVLPQTDFVYAAQNHGVKEYIILNSPEAPTEFSFDFSAEGYTAEKTEHGTVEFKDENGEAVFELGALFAVDMLGSYTHDLEYSIIKTVRGGYEIVVRIAEEYLNDENRVFPVLVDPSVMVTGASVTFDNYAASAQPTVPVYYKEHHLRTGKYSDSGVCRSYIRFTLPESVMNKAISNAYLRIKRSGGRVGTVRCYPVQQNWSPQTLTWSNKPLHGLISVQVLGAIGSSGLLVDSNDWYKADVTNLTQLWVVAPEYNCGLMLMETDETSYSNQGSFYSSDAPSPNKPELRINYDTFSHSVASYYDKGYSVYHEETLSESCQKIQSYLSAISPRYKALLGLQIYPNGTRQYNSIIDACKGNVTLSNINNLCGHSNQIHTNVVNICNSFMSSYPGNNRLTTVFWTEHRVPTSLGDNRSFYSNHSVFMLGRQGSLRETLSKNTLMHEINHHLGAPDHYCQLVNGSCIGGEYCVLHGGNKPRPSSCVMSNIRTELNADYVMCAWCKLDIIQHLKSTHK